MTDPAPENAVVHLACDGSAFTAEMERLRDQTEELAATHHGERGEDV